MSPATTVGLLESQPWYISPNASSAHDSEHLQLKHSAQPVQAPQLHFLLQSSSDSPHLLLQVTVGVEVGAAVDAAVGVAVGVAVVALAVDMKSFS